MEDQSDFLRLKDLVINQKSRLLEYKNLFAGKDQAFQKYILNTTASGFFRILFDLFWNDMVLSVSKLTDPAESRTKGGVSENLTVPRLVKAWEAKDAETFALMKSRLEELEVVVESVRTYRSKVVAHQDFEQAMSGNLIVELKSIEKAFEIVGTILNIHSQKVGLGYYGFDSEPVAGANSILYAIEESMIYRIMKKARRSPVDDRKEREAWEAEVGPH